MDPSRADFEYVVVGSGAGGGTLAARLAEYGHRVLLLEAGGDPRQLRGSDPNTPGENRLPDDYDVPAFHALASENEAMSWDFWVDHYKDKSFATEDPKYYKKWKDKEVNGVLYPRGGTLGGCTAHNAMITVYPHNKDWEYIAGLTKDDSWSPDNMRGYFERLENCRHRPLMRFLAKLGYNPSRHGWKGWLHTEMSVPRAILGDKKLKHLIADVTEAEIADKSSSRLQRFKWALLGRFDPNDWRLVQEDSVGVRLLPMATKRHARMGSRERVLEVAERLSDNLVVELDALVTRVLFDEKEPDLAVGVEYLKGARLYRASKNPSSEEGQKRTVRVSREVILCGGAYNSPQLLMLSGIGPPAELARHGIKVRVPLDGVGSNLQDRYEVGVVYKMNFPEWWVLEGAQFNDKDKQYARWKKRRSGVYATNGVVSAVFLKSFKERPLPDLFLFALIGRFRGYYPEYSTEFAKYRNYLTWCILKAHTNNCAGTVRLRNDNPRETPAIDFCYFNDGTADGGDDLRSVRQGVIMARKFSKELVEKGMMVEEMPGPGVQKDKEIDDYIRKHAWGHHACGTCAIGDVVNGDFEVRDTRGLRVVDASVFPKIPGFFIVSSIYTIAEKAADVISAAAKKRG